MYPLPFDKSKINFNPAYMQQGGKQLIELMENEFPYDWIIANQKELKISDSMITCFKLWCENNCVVGKVQNIMGYRDSSMAKSFFFRGGGILKKLMQRAKLEPVVDENGEIITPKYSFIECEVYGEKDYIVVIVRPNKNDWFDHNVHPSFEKIIKRYYLIKDGKLVTEEDPIYQEFQDSIMIMEKLSV